MNHARTAKLAPAFAWLFALGSIALAIAGSYATAGLGTKVTWGVFFGVFAVGGFCASYLTSASKAIAIVAFVLAAGITGASYYALVASTVSGAVSAAGGSTASQAGQSVGSFFGLVAAVVTFVDALVAGVGGVIVGSKARMGLQASAT